MLFNMCDFGICKKVDLGKQTNGAGKIFMRSEHDAIETSKYANPIRDPLTVFFVPIYKDFFLKMDFIVYLNARVGAIREKYLLKLRRAKIVIMILKFNAYQRNKLVGMMKFCEKYQQNIYIYF